MRTRRLLVAVGAAAVTLAPGCGSAAPSAESVAWMDEVCGSLLGFTEVADDTPAIDPADPVAAAHGLRTYLDAAGPALDRALADLAEVGVSPAPGGDALVAQLTDRLGRYRDGFNAARSELAELENEDPEAVAAALPVALAPLGELSTLPPVGSGSVADLDPDTELGRAAQEAPNCRAIRTDAS